MEFGVPFVALAFAACAAATIGFPMYGWVRDKKRRGEHIRLRALLAVFLLGLLGVIALGALVGARWLITGG